MSGKGAHINVLGERIRRYYEHLMTDAHTIVDELRKDLEGPMSQQISHAREQRTAAPDARGPGSAASPPNRSSQNPSSPGPSSSGPSPPGKRAH
jgi:hypothetical protein